MLDEDAQPQSVDPKDLGVALNIMALQSPGGVSLVDMPCCG